MSLRLILECFIIIATSLCFLRFIFCKFRLMFFSFFIDTASLLICLSFSKSFMLFMLLRAISFFLFFLTFFIFYFAAVFHLRILLVVGRTFFFQNYFLVGFGNRIFQSDALFIIFLGAFDWYIKNEGCSFINDRLAVYLSSKLFNNVLRNVQAKSNPIFIKMIALIYRPKKLKQLFLVFLLYSNARVLNNQLQNAILCRFKYIVYSL